MRWTKRVMDERICRVTIHAKVQGKPGAPWSTAALSVPVLVELLAYSVAYCCDLPVPR